MNIEIKTLENGWVVSGYRENRYGPGSSVNGKFFTTKEEIGTFVTSLVKTANEIQEEEAALRAEYEKEKLSYARGELLGASVNLARL